MSGRDARDETVGIASIPGLRTFASPRFRLVIAMIVALFGVAMNVARLVAFDMSDPSVLLDFPAYYDAAERMLNGASPYTASQFELSQGAYCFDCYLYPPLFAQLLSPIALVPLETAKMIWLVIAYGAAFASTWLATGIGGAGRSLERVLWCLAAVMLFDVVGSAVWVGNVGTLVALSVTLVALGGFAAGVGAGLGTLLKVAPGTLLPAAFAADRDSRTALVATFAIGVGASFLLAPQAWLEYPVILRHVFADPSSSSVNLSISQLASDWGWGPGAISVVRLLMVSAGGACIVVSIWLARQRGGMPAAALLGTVAMLIIPATLWFHYLAVLLPFAAMAWPRGGAGSRGLLLVSAALIGITTYWEQALSVYLGSALLLLVAGWVLWPRPAHDPPLGRSRSAGGTSPRPRWSGR